MTATIEFFPVGNGDMTLIRLASGKTILIDIDIRNDADDEKKDECPDVAKMLRNRLERDANNENRLYVDAFILTHPDRDHCSGLQRHFHLGAPSTWKKPHENEWDKIVIHEMWSSPLTFRRLKKSDGGLVPDAQAWKKEAKRRVCLEKKGDKSAGDLGNMIKIIGEDKDQKTKGVEHLVVKVGDTVNEICGESDPSFSAYLLSPKIVSKKDADELKGKNNSSIVMRISLSPKEEGLEDDSATAFLTGGDAEVDIWKRIWSRNESAKDKLFYNVLQTPHHCSLGVLSYDNYSEQKGVEGKGEDCRIDEQAYSAISQAEKNAYIVASSEEPEKETGKDLAKRKYENIAESAQGSFLCTMRDSKDEPLKIEVTEDGPKPSSKKDPIPDPPRKPNKGSTEKSYA